MHRGPPHPVVHSFPDEGAYPLRHRGFRGIIARDFTFATLHRLAEAYGRYLLDRGGGPRRPR